MNITFHLDAPDHRPGSGPVVIGWFADADVPQPERVSFRGGNRTHAKSASRCPGVIQLESRYFLIRSPFELHLRFTRDENGQPLLQDLTGQGPLPVTLLPQSAWRTPTIPTMRLSLPYHFVSDEICYMTQLDSFAHFRPGSLPGVIISRRQPIHTWPGLADWTFEWHDTAQPLHLHQNDPLFYCQFEADGPDRPVQLTRISYTPEIRNWLDRMAAADALASQTQSLLETAVQARPAELLIKRAR